MTLSGGVRTTITRNFVVRWDCALWMKNLLNHVVASSSSSSSSFSTLEPSFASLALQQRVFNSADPLSKQSTLTMRFARHEQINPGVTLANKRQIQRCTAATNLKYFSRPVIASSTRLTFSTTTAAADNLPKKSIDHNRNKTNNHLFEWGRNETGRARKRRRRVVRQQERAAALEQQQEEQQLKSDAQEQLHKMNSTQSVGRKEYPWAVLFPTPRNDPEGRFVEEPKPEAMSWAERRVQFRQAWILYKSTWDGFGIGTSTSSLSREDKDGSGGKETKQSLHHPNQDENFEKISMNLQSNVERNLEFTQREGEVLLKHAKEQTGLETKEDVKAFATELLKLLTLCLKEFMVGYRKARDDEIDRVLHEYFQDKAGTKDSTTNNDDDNATKKDASTSQRRQRRRRPKQRILVLD
jgi:hypothetical protein